MVDDVGMNTTDSILVPGRAGEGGEGPGVWPPVGWVDRFGAAALLGVSAHTVKLFALAGKLVAGRKVIRPNGSWGVVYAREDVDRLRAERDAASGQAVPAGELFGEHARLNFPDGVDARLEQETRNDMNQRQAA